MNEVEQRWSDLKVRVASAIVMVIVGMAATLIGGEVFYAFIAILCGLMTWELWRMLSPAQNGHARIFGVLAGLTSFLAAHLDLWLGALIVLAPAVLGALVISRYSFVFAAFCALILVAGLELELLRVDNGVPGLLWLVLVVIASDVMGYFVGRMLGGPKFWPRVSPKKTWSGTVAGWIGAGCIGLIFARIFGVSATLALFSVLTAFAAQMGDICESAVKRMVGVKDSSALIPGHGGLLDRFDAMIGAGVFLFVAGLFLALPLGFE